MEFLIPADHDTYTDLNVLLYIRGKLTKADSKGVKLTDFTCVANNLLHSLFEQYNISLNGLTITHSAGLDYYLAYFQTLLTYGNEAAESHLTNALWYRDTGDLGVCDPTAGITPSTNTGYVVPCDRLKQSKKIEMVSRLHTDINSVPTHLLPVSGYRKN